MLAIMNVNRRKDDTVKKVRKRKIFYILFCSVDRLDEPGGIAPDRAITSGVLQAKIHSLDGRGRRPRDGSGSPLRILREVFPPDFSQVKTFFFGRDTRRSVLG